LPCALLVLAVASPAAATAANRQRLQVNIDQAGGRLDHGSRPVTLHFRLSRWTDSGAISSPAAEDRFLLPRGFAVHPAALGQCDLNVLVRKGPSAGRACQIGSGTLQLGAMTVNPSPPASGTVTIFNARPSGGRPAIVTYALVTRPIRSEFWFKASVRSTRRGDVIVVRETRLSIYGVPLTVLALDFTFGRAVGRGADRRSYMTGPAPVRLGRLPDLRASHDVLQPVHRCGALRSAAAHVRAGELLTEPRRGQHGIRLGGPRGDR